MIARIVVAMLLLGAPALQGQSLAKRLDARLDRPPFNRQLWGVAVVDDRGRLLYGRNQDRLFMPASNTKIVVTAVASALLPPDWTVRTSVYPGGPVVKGIVQGDLVLYGRGDPTMGHRCYATDTLVAGVCDTDSFARLRELADTLAARGIHEVRGDVVGDGSYFEPLTVNPNWEGFDLNWWYAAAVTGLGFNDNSVDFVWGPGPAPGAPGVITMSPNLGDVAFENRTVTVAPGGESDIGDRFYRTPGTMQVWAEGTVTRDHPIQTESFAIPDPNLYAARALRQMLGEAGISVTGTTRSTTDSLLYLTARKGTPLAEVRSRPLKDWVFPILNTSQNWFAEMLLKQLGRQFGHGGSWKEGHRRRATLSHGLGEGRLHGVLTARRLRIVEREPDNAARLYPDTALHTRPSQVCHLRGGAPPIGQHRLVADPIHRHAAGAPSAGEDRQHRRRQHIIGLCRDAWRSRDHFFGDGEPSYAEYANDPRGD